MTLAVDFTMVFSVTSDDNPRAVGFGWVFRPMDTVCAVLSPKCLGREAVEDQALALQVQGIHDGWN